MIVDILNSNFNTFTLGIVIVNFILHYYLNKIIRNKYNYNNYISFRLSYNFVSIISYLLIIYYTLLEFSNKNSNLYNSTLFTERFINSYDYTYQLSIIYISYEIYSTLISIYLKNWLIIAHHIGLIYMMLKMLKFNIFQYYIFYCSGLSTISNVPLAIADIFKTNKIFIEKYPKAFLTTKWLFNISFIYIRIFTLTNIYIRFLYDINNIYDGESINLSPLQFSQDEINSFLLILYYLVVIFTILQYYWFILILNKVKRSFYEIIKGKKEIHNQ